MAVSLLLGSFSLPSVDSINLPVIQDIVTGVFTLVAAVVGVSKGIRAAVKVIEWKPEPHMLDSSDITRRLTLMEERITLAERNHQSLSSRYNRLRDRVEELRVSLMRTTGEFPAHDDPSSESPDESET
jgi:hypothetical protein